MKREYFNFCKEWVLMIEKYPDEIQLELYDAIVSYGLTGVSHELSHDAKTVFSIIKKEIDKDKDNPPFMNDEN